MRPEAASVKINPDPRAERAEKNLKGKSPMAESERIVLHQAQVGPMANFVYLIGDPVTRKAAVVDPAWDVDKIIKWAERYGMEIEHILITHYHPDHLGGSMAGEDVLRLHRQLSHLPGRSP